MKMKTIALAFLSLTLTQNLQAATKVLTSLSQSSGHVLAGVKVLLDGHEPDTYLLKVSAETMKSQKVELPSELAHREVVFIQPTLKGDVLVVTQRKVEQGDNPLLHRYSMTSGKWEKVREVECASIAAISVAKGSLDFKCLVTTKDGDEEEKPVKVLVSDIESKDALPGNFPQERAKADKFSAELVGERTEWHELKITKSGKSKVVKP